ncbi:hypothetical protein [Archangium sp.]|uniref:hypothetical protein n=1 Tax=Archangium sp. TaxID=1872627 RepID=UPI00389A9FF1
MLPDSYVSIDDSRWPLQVVKFVGSATLRQHEQVMEGMTARLRRRERHLSLIDLSQGGIPTAEQRQRYVLWIQENEALMREVLLGMALVINSPAMRLAVSTVMHLKPLPVPYFIASWELDAAAWSIAHLEDQGLRPHAERLRSQYGLTGRLDAGGTARSA